MEPKDIRFYNPYELVDKTLNRLPHWHQIGRTYFITFHLADSVPAVLRAQWKKERVIWLSYHPEPWTTEVQAEYHRRFSAKMDAWLDAGHGSCLLKQPGCRAFVEATLKHDDGACYTHHAWVVMPNHVHVLASLIGETHLKTNIQSWKGVSVHGINKYLNRRGHLWQEDYFDRLIRDGEHFANCVRYIRRNPVKANLREGSYTHYETDLARTFAPLDPP